MFDIFNILIFKKFINFYLSCLKQSLMLKQITLN